MPEQFIWNAIVCTMLKWNCNWDNDLAIPPSKPTEEDYQTKMTEELRLLTAWKKRCSYERTNPERLPPSELLVRVRADTSALWYLPFSVVVN